MEPKKCRALVLYWSHGGNTKDVAEAIRDELEKDERIETDIREMRKDLTVRYDAYQIIFIGSPVYSFLPPPDVTAFLKNQNKLGTPVAPAAPEIRGMASVVFCTYGGGHTGVNEAIPTLKYIGQFMEHAGIRVVEEWPVVGDFPDVQDKTYRETGRLGSIVGRPDKSELDSIRGRVAGLVRRLQHVVGLVD